MRPAGGAVTAVEPISVPPSVSAYCRQARRLRGTLGHQPARMHRKLRELAVNRTAGISDGVGPVEGRPHGTGTSKARAFAERVGAGLDGTVLRYATRRALLREAAGVGIGAFEANLIIAAVQHERRATRTPAPAPGEKTPSRGLPRLAPFLVIVSVEAAVALCAWHVFFV